MRLALLPVLLFLVGWPGAATAALKEPVPMVRTYRVPAGQAWLALQPPAEGWTVLVVDSLTRLVTLAVPLGSPFLAGAKVADGTVRKPPASGTVAASMWVQSLGDTASKIHLRVRIYGPRGDEQSHPTRGDAERALFGAIESRLGLGAVR